MQVSGSLVPSLVLAKNNLRFCFQLTSAILASVLLVSCVTGQNYQELPPGEGPGVPPSIELQKARQIATFHFPRGLYVLQASDNTGYYYRAPGYVTNHGFNGSDRYEGGLFLKKGAREKVQGYVKYADHRARIGHLSPKYYEFREGTPPPLEPEPPERIVPVLRPVN